MSAFECHPQRALSINARVITDDREREERRGTLFHLFELSTPLIIKAAFFPPSFSPPSFENAQREKEIRSIVAFWQFYPITSTTSPPPLPHPLHTGLSFNLWPLKKQSPDGEAHNTSSLCLSSSSLSTFSLPQNQHRITKICRWGRGGELWIGARKIVSHNSGGQIDVSCKLCHSSSGVTPPALPKPSLHWCQAGVPPVAKWGHQLLSDCQRPVTQYVASVSMMSLDRERRCQQTH